MSVGIRGCSSGGHRRQFGVSSSLFAKTCSDTGIPPILCALVKWVIYYASFRIRSRNQPRPVPFPVPRLSLQNEHAARCYVDGGYGLGGQFGVSSSLLLPLHQVGKLGVKKVTATKLTVGTSIHGQVCENPPELTPSSIDCTKRTLS